MNTRFWMVVGIAAILSAGPVAAQDAHDHHHGHHHEAAAPTAPAIEAEITSEHRLVAGRNNGLRLVLTHKDGGFPVFWEQLKPVHDARIHLLIVDPAFQDYHHEHPTRTDKEGEYAFFLNPRTDCDYKLWAQVHFKDGGMAENHVVIPGAAGDCADHKRDEATISVSEVEGYRFVLGHEGAIRRGADTMLTVRVEDKEGTPFEELEPVMGAFAHLVGFYADGRTLAHLHPSGEEPGGKHDRGGPELSFHFRPDQAGPVKFFAQVRIGNRDIFAPFVVVVE